MVALRRANMGCREKKGGPAGTRERRARRRRDRAVGIGSRGWLAGWCRRSWSSASFSSVL